MKNLFFLTFLIILITIFFSCDQNNSNNTNTATEINLDWLVGEWKRTNDKAGRTTYEQWEKISKNELIGLGFTMEGKDTVFKEEMVLLPINDVWNLKVSGPNEQPVFFNFTKQTKNSFVCENPEHDFPKKITYNLQDEKIHATVSADGHKIAFDFEKIKF